jgi:uncharacterized membrane protein
VEFPWKRENYLLLLLGIVIIVLGFIFLSIGPVYSFWSLDLAPVLLVLGYCVILPIAIIYRRREKRTSDGEGIGSKS